MFLKYGKYRDKKTDNIPTANIQVSLLFHLFTTYLGWIDWDWNMKRWNVWCFVDALNN